MLRKRDFSKKERTIDDIISEANKIHKQNHEIKRQLKKVSKALKSTELKCQKLANNHGQMIVYENAKRKNSNSRSNKIRSNKQNAAQLERHMEHNLELSKPLGDHDRKVYPYVLFIAFFTELGLSSRFHAAKEVQSGRFSNKGALLVYEKDFQTVGIFENDSAGDSFTIVDLCFFVVKYVLLFIILIFLSNMLICCYFYINNLQISIHTSRLPYF